MRATLRHLSSICTVVLVAAAAACDGGGGTGGDVLTPAGVTAVSGNNQTAVAGSAVAQPVVVRVVDASGRPVPNLAVSFVVTEGGGTAAPAVANTGADGTAQATWTLGTSTQGAQTLEARVASGATTFSQAFHATATAGAAAGVAAVGNTALSLAPGASTVLAVRVADAHGNPVSGAPVTWSAAGGGTLSGAAATTGADGTAQATLTMGGDLAAPATVDAAAAGGTVHFTATGTLPADAVVEPVAGNGAGIVAGTTVQLTARVRTAGGTPIAHVPVTFTGSCCTAAPLTAQTGADGTATVAWAPTVAGAQSMRATVAGVADDATFAVAVSPAAYNHAVQVAPAGFSITAGQTVDSPFRLRVLDRYDNPVPGVTVNWTVRTGGGTVSPTTSVTDASGIASTQWQFNTVAGQQNFTATVAGLDPSQDFRVLVSPGPVASFQFQQPSITVSLSSTSQVQAQAKAFDQYGNVIAPVTAVAWTSSDTSVFDVDQVGTVGSLKYYYANLVRRGPGTAQLRVQLGSVFAEIPVTITP